MTTTAVVINTALDQLLNKEITAEQYLEIVAQADAELAEQELLAA